MKQNLVKNNIGRLIILVVLALVALGLNYIFTPALTINSAGMWWFVFSISLIGLIAYAIFENYSYSSYIGTIVCSVIAGITILCLIFVSFFSSAMFHSDSYRERVTIVENCDFTNDVINPGDMVIVDVATAEKVGDRTIAKVKNSTWYEVSDEYNLIRYRGEYYRISPLNYGGLLKWNRAKTSGIPGYVLVNARTQEATFVECEHFRLSTSGYFGDNLKRHLRYQYPQEVFGRSFFEIDEEGNPYWITSIMEKTLGLWSNQVEKRFIVTNAVTGESVVYETSELPEWIDHAYDLTYMMEAVTDNFQYVNGFWNSIGSKTGVNKLSYNYKDQTFAGYNSTIDAEGNVVFFTAVTPANRAESILGFIQLNPRTGEVKRYDVNGAEESSAQVAAQSLVQNYGYIASYPTIVNVEGEPTYVLNLKDSAGLVQRYALVNVSNYTIAVEDTTLEDALPKYLNKMNLQSVDLEETKTLTGVILNLFQAEIDGYTHFYFTFAGEDGLYVSPITNSQHQVLLKTGMTVNIEYTENSEENVFMVKKISF